MFVIGAITAQPNQDTSGSISILRRKSSILEAEEEKKEHDENSGHDQLVNLLRDTAGTELLLTLNFEKLQT